MVSEPRASLRFARVEVSGVVQWSDRPNPAWLGNVYQLAKGLRDGDGAAGHPRHTPLAPLFH